MDREISDAPKRMKHPVITRNAFCIEVRPENIDRPTTKIAMVASPVGSGPPKKSSIHREAPNNDETEISRKMNILLKTKLRFDEWKWVLITTYSYFSYATLTLDTI